MKIIPAIDIIEGKCVRLTQGDYSQKKIYHQNPVEVAKMFEGYGLKHLHLVDLDGAKANQVVNYKVLEEICTQTTLQVEFSGGIKSYQDLKKVLESGASQVSIGSVAVKHPELFLEWLSMFGNEKIILSADVKNGYVAIQGWQEQSQVSIFDFLAYYQEKGVKYVICTDISKDGMLQGASIGLYQSLMEQFSQLNFIASGGISSEKDLETLRQIGCTGAIIGKALYEGKINLKILQSYA
ncbi:MAG: 1-(5-phosphoribosyl)-5-[(5-phosphoribosylamino)methylideneamino]imidazole-4-carboxamide isomerase [Bacteroidia bacterium]|nr:1-(5-phosphoribosyl)-5-[(5-phosphoribosylamino)methylideneamino]imidazole-4-carboxamide isomerase [Bacteroidia bacterium]MDW8346953.1 1-(5-phosphoribosyl)-5-[(5-phosphoribosylamino)methylideneamino]imidazole-4-carboxamide isomerase [Bacteroidia bacterium]